MTTTAPLPDTFPAVAAPYRGRIADLDSHLMVPTRLAGQALGTFGKVAGGISSVLFRFNKEAAVAMNPEESPVSADNVWTVKGAAAPGGTHADTRLQALDLMGIRRQLVFPDVMSAFIAWGRQPGAVGAMKAHNDYALDWASDSGGRLVPAAILNVRNLDVAVAEAERMAAKGARAVMIPDGVLPGGKSPAHTDVDRLWAVLAEAGIAVLLHIGGQHGFTSGKWEQTEILRTNVKSLGSEGDPIGPHTLATMHLSPVNYLSTLIFGGVLERHPTLKLGVMELGALWVGPMAELLDNRANFTSRVSKALSLKPSEYIRRQLRVTVFWQESVGEIIDRYGLEEVFCFASDFPHREGGTDPLGEVAASLAGQPDPVLEKFFVSNGDLILGDA
ncbi:MAG TPA: amidohydrolase family protein [Acidimicrobiales bacterium]|nr:amidohydrolase family protein [Acidimicrobiales bacterium]